MVQKSRSWMKTEAQPNTSSNQGSDVRCNTDDNYYGDRVCVCDKQN